MEHQLATAGTARPGLLDSRRLSAYVALTAGLMTLGGTLAIGALSDDRPQQLPYMLILMGVSGLIWAYYYGQRAQPCLTLPMLLFMAVGGIAGAYTVTFTVGMAVFPGQWAWWGPGAAVAALPMFAVAALVWRAGNRQ